MGVKLAAASGGSIELVPTNTASAFTVTVPAVTATALTDSAGILNIGSGQIYKDASGNVGIGMTPTNFGNGYTVLQVANATNGGMLYLTNTSNAGGRIYGNAAGITYDAFDATYHAFNTNGAERARIDSIGNFTVGAAVAATNRVININGVVNKAQRIAFQESGVDRWLMGNGAASENGVFQIYDATNGTGVQLSRGATSWAAISDERLKDIIEPITGAANKVSTLRAVIGKYKTDEVGMRRSFLIAQDVQAVFPEAVDDTNPEKLGVRYTEIIPLLVAAIKEQQALIVQLQADVAALKGAQA